MLMARNTMSCIFSLPNAFAGRLMRIFWSRQRNVTSHCYTLYTLHACVYVCMYESVCVCVCVKVYVFTRPLCTVRYKGLLFTTRFIFHRNIMENGPRRYAQRIVFPPLTPPTAHISLPFSLWPAPSAAFWHLFNAEICTYRHPSVIIRSILFTLPSLRLSVSNY